MIVCATLGLVPGYGNRIKRIDRGVWQYQLHSSEFDAFTKKASRVQPELATQTHRKYSGKRRELQ
jgi:hypothetical protein